MIGPAGPAQTEVETTTTPSEPSVTPTGLEGAAHLEQPAGNGVGPVGADDAAGLAPGAPVVATTSRRTAVIGSGSVPKGNLARSMPVASTRNTSAVWAIE
jgi:hypothetical protein